MSTQLTLSNKLKDLQDYLAQAHTQILRMAKSEDKTDSQQRLVLIENLISQSLAIMTTLSDSNFHMPKSYDPSLIKRSKYIRKLKTGRYQICIPRANGTRTWFTEPSFESAFLLRNQLLRREWDPNHELSTLALNSSVESLDDDDDFLAEDNSPVLDPRLSKALQVSESEISLSSF